MKNKYYDEFLNHYDEFYFVLRSVSILGTQSSDPFNEDASKIIQLLGAVYQWSSELIDEAVHLILYDLMRVGLYTDYNALSSKEMLDDDITENMIFYEAKGKAIADANKLSRYSEQKNNQENQSGTTNEIAFHHPYEAKVVYQNICSLARMGDISSTTQKALMEICGIGCDKNIQSAQVSLERALIWGEYKAADILSYLWSFEDHSEAEFYSLVSQILSKNSLNERITTDVEKLCYLIKAVYSYIFRNQGQKGIDTLFADYLRNDEISFDEKLNAICKYKEATWLLTSNKQPYHIGLI